VGSLWGVGGAAICQTMTCILRRISLVLAIPHGSMTPEPIHIAVDKSLHELTALMYTHRVRRIAAVDGDHQVVGVVTLDDVLALLGEEMSDMARTVLESFLHKPLAADPWTHGKGRHPPYRLLLTLLAARLSPGPLARPRELP
jgi:Mg/Co/Ni transporter MgtE